MGWGDVGTAGHWELQRRRRMDTAVSGAMAVSSPSDPYTNMVAELKCDLPTCGIENDSPIILVATVDDGVDDSDVPSQAS